ncbi:MAG: hypothetical protein LC124_11085 [Ignavibacteriales bacterium]|nr:hypothetical protein [Ignavibacteriales bacterium]
MENIDFVIIIFSLVLLLSFFRIKKSFFRISLILFLILSAYIIIIAFIDYQGAIGLVNTGEGSPGVIPDLVKGIYTTFILFMIYSFINIILLSLFYKRQLKQNAIVKP